MPVLIVLVALGAATNAFSQIGVYVGGYAGISAQKPSFEDVTFDTNTAFFYGLRGGIRFLMLALELNYFSAMHNIEMGDFLLFNWDGKINDYSYIGLNLKYIFSLAVLHPYLTAGYGYYTADIHNIDRDKDRGYNVGAGLEVSFNRRISLVVEGKYHHVTVDITKIQLELGNFTLSGGLNIHF